MSRPTCSSTPPPNDGAHVFFETDEQLESGDDDNQFDIYDRFGGTTTYICDGAGATGDGAV